MGQPLIKRSTRHVIAPRIDMKEIKKILSDTAGLWQGRKLDPIAYQSAMRRSYATEHKTS